MTDFIVASGAYFGSTETILTGMFGLPNYDNHVKRYRWWRLTGM